MENKKFKIGQKVEVNGNKEGYILSECSHGMWNIRLWSGSRHVGDICVREEDIKNLEDGE